MIDEATAPVEKYGLVQYVTPDFWAHGPWHDALKRNLLRSVSRRGFQPVSEVTIAPWPLDPGEAVPPEVEAGGERYRTMP